MAHQAIPSWTTTGSSWEGWSITQWLTPQNQWLSCWPRPMLSLLDKPSKGLLSSAPKTSSLYLTRCSPSGFHCIKLGFKLMDSSSPRVY